MKHYMVLLLATGFTMSVLAQEGKPVTPPAAAKAAFEKAWPGISGVKWYKEEGDYEAEFKKEGKKMSAIYDLKGALKETEVEITVAELPKGVGDYVKQHHKGAAIKDPAKTTRADGSVIYEIEIKETTLVFDNTGKFIKEEKEVDEKD
ncbi:hypothetical protein [Paraflavitalea speifideaquila]|uniref:hypothetical protein n=1 Tax=Paraflavitalea speifideaquila TaxID=3076558 RepID=UPI0028EECA28|nr:hypothetical protein [Paraflavitalea speifideiaquila]